MKKRYVKISRQDFGFYFQPIERIKEAISSEFDMCDVGDKLFLEVVEMDDSEYENLPEFTGW